MFMKRNKSKKRYDTKEYIESFFLKCLSEIKLFLPSLNFEKLDNNTIKINGSEEDTGFYIEIFIRHDEIIVFLDPKISWTWSGFIFSYDHYHPFTSVENPYNEQAVKDDLIDTLEEIMEDMSNRYRVIRTFFFFKKYQRLVNGVWRNEGIFDYIFDIFDYIKAFFFKKNQDNYKVIGQNYVLSTEDDYSKLELYFKKLRKEI